MSFESNMKDMKEIEKNMKEIEKNLKVSSRTKWYEWAYIGVIMGTVMWAITHNWS